MYLCGVTLTIFCSVLCKCFDFIYESPNMDYLPPQKNISELILAVPKAGSAGITKHSIKFLFGTELGNFMESFWFYISFWTEI